MKILNSLLVILLLLILGITPQAQAAGKYEIFPRDPKPAPNGGECSVGCGGDGCCPCRKPINDNHKKIRAHVTDEFIKHRDWMIDELFTKHILPAMALMTSQLATISIQQVQTVGSFFDAKHQLETQQLFQQLMAEAHRDYQPSEGLCEIGTNVRSLAASSRKSDLGYVAFANRIMARALRSNDTLSGGGANFDIKSRVNTFIKKHCNKTDNGNGLNRLCEKGGGQKSRINKDTDFTRTIESKLTLDVDFTKDGAGKATDDEEDLFAFMSNIFGHKPTPLISKRILADGNGNPRVEAHRYMNLRSLAAKRSVAQNSFAAMVSERAKGDKEVAPYLKKIVTELGIKDEDVHELLGEEPSYFAQMEVLTKKIYQNPTFYTELYDKPANVLRKGASIRAIGLMQDRDIYKSLLRSEAVLSVLLETMMHTENERVYRQLKLLSPDGDGAYE